jgi:uncharacterized protein YjhX (UPF0386 family)
MEYFRVFTAKQGIELYLKTGMLLTRVATPKKLRTIASQYTGKPYKASRAGLEAALADLRTLLDNFKAQQVEQV